MSGAPSLPEQVPRTGNEATAPRASSSASFQLHDGPVDNLRPLRVVVIGAGFSGIYCGIRMSERLRNVDFVIYDKNSGVGGTWWENRYVGCACDIPSHSYQYSFNPNKRWSGLYAPAAEIREYLEATVKKYSVDRFIKLSHKVDECRWDEQAGKWRMKITDLGTGRAIEDSAEVVVNARGGLNEPSWPDIEGLNSFKGKLLHSAMWDESYDFKNKNISVIGAGSSSIQIVPNLQKLAGTKLAVFVRGRTWISPPFGQQLWDSMDMKGYDFTQEQIDKFTNDPAAYQEFRLAVEADGNGIHSFTMKNTPIQNGARDFFYQTMKQRLESKPEIFERIIPSFAPGCRRLTPGPGYLEALTQPNVSFVTTPIKSIEADGIRTNDGTLHETDALVCATGFKAFVAPPFPILGQGGASLAEHWVSYPSTYLSLATDGFPNHFMMLGPNGAIGTGSLTMMMEATGDYIVKCIRKLQKDNYKSMVPRPARVGDFVDYARAYFQGTVYKDGCRSWYKNANDDVTGLWPGSTLHCIESLRSPRWEDWEYVALPAAGGGSVNRMAWLGNGWTDNQAKSQHLAWYLLPEFLEETVPTAPRPEESARYAKRPFSY